jgi:hypothetical protein
VAIEKLTSRKFWNDTGLEAKARYRKFIFEQGKNVYGGKWLDGKYSTRPSKWVMINILKQHRQSAPEGGYSYAEAKKRNLFRRQFSTKNVPILTSDLFKDFKKFLKVRNNGVQFGYATKGNVVKGLRERFGNKGTLTSTDKPLPNSVRKYIVKEYRKFIKKNSKNQTRIHKKGRTRTTRG